MEVQKNAAVKVGIEDYDSLKKSVLRNHIKNIKPFSLKRFHGFF
jgi:hypothetical protein